MNPRPVRNLLCGALLLLSVPWAWAESAKALPPQIAPPSPPVRERVLAQQEARLQLAAPGPYSIGDPTDEEQLYLEFINRARADPAAEGRRLASATDEEVLHAYDFFKVDLALVESQFNAIPAAPPLSLNAQLTTSARRHSRDMFQNEFQGHVGSDGSSSEDRVTATGYRWNAIGENVYSEVKSVWYGHAGFNVDWGIGPGGIQNPPGHRNSIHSPLFREVGVGVVLGTNGKVGPQIVTEDFARRDGVGPFVTGVVFYDFNGNQFYDLGEGIGGVRVRVSGTDTFAVTARSGGYSVPVTGDGARTVTFQVPGLADVERSVTTANQANVKIDHVPVYSPPVIGGSSVAVAGRDNPYVFSPVGAATAYEWRWVARTPWIEPEGAEGSLGRFLAFVTPGYDVRATGIRHEGASSFRLAHPRDPETLNPTNQVLVLQRPIRLGTASQLTFWSRLGWAEGGQVARVQASEDNGQTWTDVWSQTGSGNEGELSFNLRQVSLEQYAGRSLILRFAFTLTVGRFFPQAEPGFGWYIDDIRVSDSEELTDGPSTSAGLGPVFQFRPPNAGSFLLQVRALIGDRVLDWGPPLSLIAETGGPVPPRVRVTGMVRESDGRWNLGFQLEEGEATSFELEGKASLAGAWATEVGATIESTGAPSGFRVLIPPKTDATHFFRITTR